MAWCHVKGWCSIIIPATWERVADPISAQQVHREALELVVEACSPNEGFTAPSASLTRIFSTVWRANEQRAAWTGLTVLYGIDKYSAMSDSSVPWPSGQVNQLWRISAGVCVLFPLRNVHVLHDFENNGYWNYPPLSIGIHSTEILTDSTSPL